MMLACAMTAQAAQNTTQHRMRNAHRTEEAALDADPLDATDARFLLTRTGFAANASEVTAYIGKTREEAVDALLAGARTEAATPPPAWATEPIPSADIRRAWTQDQRRDDQREQSRRYDELRGWWVREMVTTRSPLTERMTLFWHDHFPSAEEKVHYPQLMFRQNALLRRDALGNFGDLLHAVSKDPAMLQYLDGAGSRKGRPNENFAREVMELFTLGEGHYSQRDVTEAARAYTGWTLDPNTLAYQFNPKIHDDGDKTVLAQMGNFDGDQVLDILLAQPQTATFITTELWREFISETPDPAQIAPVAERFRASHYDIKTALRGLFLSEAFWDERNRGVLVKSPVEFVLGAVREFDIGYADQDATPLAVQVRNFGENLFYPPNVKGWPGGENWINSSTLLARKQFIEQLFRATEAHGMRPATAARGPVNPMASPIASPMTNTTSNMMSNAAMKPAATPRPRPGLRFDLDAWLAQYNTTPDARPDLSTQLQLQRAVLAVSPADAIEPDVTSSAYLRVLLMDPAYQLK
ncbi:MAG: hypothetical protein JWQ50_6015 [Caballeronia mineralivorans]|nr:hypothetical protein [Caballeronia mineralivorans]MEA3102513.1 hypothetical protein [Caballeronia mineralivorans]